jgi:DNA replicative helicase MCM subunit Mcm2 (Cdc46/Mcm family)
VEVGEAIKLAEEFMEMCYKAEFGVRACQGKDHIVLNFNDLIKYSPLLAEELLEQPGETMKVFEIAAKNLNEDLLQGFVVRWKNLVKSSKVPINKVRVEHIGKFISVEGMIKQKSEVRGVNTLIRFECPSCGAILNILQQDERRLVSPSKCVCGRHTKFREVKKEQINMYSMMLEESAEYSTGSKLARLKIKCRADLCHSSVERLLFQGGKVEVTGILNEMTVLENGVPTNRIDWFLDANYIKVFGDSYTSIKWTQEDIKEFEKLSKKPDWLDLLRKSIFHDIVGYEYECKGVILQAFGGVSQEREGMNTRGEFHVLLVGDPGCVCENTLVSTPNGGFKRINAFGENHLQPIKGKVMIDRRGNENYNGDLKTFFKYLNQKTKIITLETGKQLTCTYNHPWFQRPPKKQGTFQKLTPFKWTRADELKVGDRLKVMPTIKEDRKDYVIFPKDGKNVDEDFAEYNGYLHGDGTVWKSGDKKYTTLTIYICEAEKDLLEHFNEIVQRRGYKPKISQYKFVKNGEIEGRQFIRTQKMFGLVIYNTQLAQGLIRPKDRRLPDHILESKKSVQAAFIRGLFEADGCIFVARTKDRSDKGSIQLKSTYPQLLQDVQTLLIRFGIKARINQDNLVIKRVRDIQIFIEEIGFISEKKRTIQQKVYDIVKKINSPRKNHTTERIIKIEEGQIQDVYDIEVEKYHRFIANGVISHNSAKSSILKIMQQFSPKAMYVAGSGVTGAGLTGAVVKDELLGSYTVEAGAMVLCSGGVLMIDELDKIGEDFKKALHEPLEQNTVSINKASIQATMVAKTAVCAAANPKQGSYSDYDSLFSQIDMSSTLINRFDLVFPVLDSRLTADDDYKIARKMLSRGQKNETKDTEYDREFIRKYIAYAKTFNPTMNPDIQEYLALKYKQTKIARKRAMEQDKQKILPITARNVDAFRRLVEAVARSRLHAEVTRDDAEIGYNYVIYSIRQVGIDPDSGEAEVQFIGVDGEVKKVERQTDVVGRMISVARNIASQEKDNVFEQSTLMAAMIAEGYDDIRKLEQYFEKLCNQGDFLHRRSGGDKQFFSLG